ncbi:kelch-like protein 24 [Branchiostoma floridae]|uniref:Kelch-like protein 24 n=1 Tax=Branchiostoma floridae TaxID=7739 RepID=A0A9J7N2S3_BRAFL|nr:kelch-like protein 24 [Branchiostoma floridae]
MMAEAQRSQTSLDFCDNPHAGSLLQGLQELRSENLLTDVVLCVSGKEIPCHRNVLAACCEYFRAMFCNGHRESKEHKVTIHEVTPGALQLLVDYAYTSKVTITQDNAVKLLEGANFFRILPVRDACVTFISNNLSAKDCLQMMHLGNMLSCPDLEKKAWLYTTKEFKATSETPEFLSLTKAQLIKLISSDDLKASEETVYTAVMTWINHNTKKRKRYMKELMELVRFPFMDKQYFFENVESNEAIRKSCQDIMTEARRCQLFPGEIQSPRTHPRHASGLREAVVVFGGIYGGRDEDSHYINHIAMTYSAEPTIYSWNSMTKPTLNFTSPCAVAVLGSSDIVMSAGKDMWLYHSELNSWSKLAQMNLDLNNHRLAVLYGKVYAIGGVDKSTPVSSVQVYDRRQNKWTAGVPLPQTRYSHAVAVLDSSIYVMGGFDKHDNKKTTSTVYRFSPGDSKWQLMKDMPKTTAYITTAVLSVSIYTGICSRIFSFTPDQDGGVWSKVVSGVPWGCGMTVLKGKVYTYGGYEKTTDNGCAAVMCLDPETQSLRRVGNMVMGLYFAPCITILNYC